ncbi:MAG TPA: PIN domain-containing protein [Thermoanaerobaculia bacterium]|nr:PIN domain-containing protein [Thermoanaerobaculia bacterium]
MILLDTSVLSRVFRRRRSGPEEERISVVLERLFASEAPLGLPAIVLQEVLSGITSERQFADLAERLQSSFVILNSATQDHVEAARLKNLCQSAGFNVSGPDCLIAVQAIAGGHRLYAIDGDFDHLAEHCPLALLRETDAG